MYRKLANYFWRCTEILCCKIKILGEIYEKIIGTEYKKENKIFDVSKSKNILHIGCGRYPITALTLVKNYDANIVVIDRDPEVVSSAIQIVNDKKLSDKIAVRVGDGTKYPMEDFDTIIVSSCSIPKIKILEHIFKTSKPNNKIIVRELKWETKAINDFIDSNNDVLLVKKIDNYSFPYFRWSSFYCMKK